MTYKNREHKSPRRLVNVGLPLEHEGDEDVAEKHAALQHRPEHARVPRYGVLGGVEREVAALAGPDDGRPEADHGRAGVQQPCRRV